MGGGSSLAGRCAARLCHWPQVALLLGLPSRDRRPLASQVLLPCCGCGGWSGGGLPHGAGRGSGGQAAEAVEAAAKASAAAKPLAASAGRRRRPRSTGVGGGEGGGEGRRGGGGGATRTTHRLPLPVCLPRGDCARLAMEPSAFPALGHRRVPSGGGFTSLHTVAARSGRLSDQIQAGNTASWVADHEVSSCSVCDVGFTLFLRKHHCRRCGHVVCDHCSKARLAVPPAYIQRVRVCDDCAKVLEDEDAAAAAACPGAAAGMLRVHTTPDQAQKSYDSIASIYDMWSSYEAPHVAAGLDALGAAAGETVVEVGCGTGKAAAMLARAVQPGGRYVGIDLSAKMRGDARATGGGSGGGGGGRRRVGGGRRRRLVAPPGGRDEPLPVEAGSADAAFLSFTLELFDTPAIPAVLGGLRAAIKPGGRLSSSAWRAAAAAAARSRCTSTCTKPSRRRSTAGRSTRRRSSRRRASRCAPSRRAPSPGCRWRWWWRGWRSSGERGLCVWM